MYIKTEMPIGTRQAHCTVCGEMFMSGEAFDIHRGIETNLESIGDNDDLRQDAGMCFPEMQLISWGLRFVDDRWGTKEDIALADKMTKARNNRN